MVESGVDVATVSEAFRGVKYLDGVGFVRLVLPAEMGFDVTSRPGV
ncbi:MAG: hypothetical protein ACP5KA_05410 [Desulfurococcaceae archaeon]